MENLLKLVGFFTVVYFGFKVLMYGYEIFTDSVKDDLISKQERSYVKKYSMNSWKPYFKGEYKNLRIKRAGLEFYITNLYDDDFEYNYKLFGDTGLRIICKTGGIKLIFTTNEDRNTKDVYDPFDLSGAFIVGDRLIEYCKGKETVTNEDIDEFNRIEEEKFK